MCVANKLNVGNPTTCTRDLNVGANGINNYGNFQMPNDKSFFFGSTSDSGTRYKLFTISCHAYMDFYDCLIIRSGPVSSIQIASLSSGGTFSINDISRPSGAPPNGTTPTNGIVIGSCSTNGILNVGTDATGTFYSWIQSRDKASATYYDLKLNPSGGIVCAGGVLCAGTCFAGSGAGLTGTANSLAVAAAAAATNLCGVGGASLSRTTTGTSYACMYQIRETVGYTSNHSQSVAPSLAFHWGGITAASIQLEESGPTISIKDIAGTSYACLKASNIATTAGICAGSCVCGVHIYGTTCACSPTVCVSTALYVGSNMTFSAGGNFNMQDGGVADSTAVRLFSASGNLYLQNGSGDYIIFRSKTGGQTACISNAGNLIVAGGVSSAGGLALCGANSSNICLLTNSAYVLAGLAGSCTQLFYAGSEKFKTVSAGVEILGTACASSWMCATDFILSSDCRLKTCIEPLTISPIDIEYKQFELISEPNRIRYGVIAQELQKTNPELVSANEEGMLGVSYTDLLIREVAYLKCRVSELEKKII
jgi:hypothetical protein